VCKKRNNVNSDLDSYNNPKDYLTYKNVPYNTAINGGDNVQLGISGPIVTLDGFKFNGSNNENHIASCKQKNVTHYSFANGKGCGFNCVSISDKRLQIPIVPPIKKSVDDKITYLAYNVEIITKITLTDNQIFYPRKRSGISKELSEAIYLHELGHQLDTWVTLSKKVLTIEKYTSCEFSGDDVGEKYDIWRNSINKLSNALQKEHLTHCYYFYKDAKSRYHKAYGIGGNPWVILKKEYPEDKMTEDNKELAMAKKNWMSNKIISAQVEQKVARLTGNRDEENKANAKLAEAERGLSDAQKDLDNLKNGTMR